MSGSSYNPNIIYLPKKIGEHSTLLYTFIFLRIAILYFSVQCSYHIILKEYYIRVFDKKEKTNSVNLYYQFGIFLFIDIFFFFLLFLFFRYIVFKYFTPYKSTLSTSFAIQYIITILIISIIGLFFINMIYNKENFLYKNDGLRAINSIKDNLFYNGIFISLLPFFLLGLQYSCSQDLIDNRKVMTDLIRNVVVARAKENY
jgi:hypothetical protein